MADTPASKETVLKVEHIVKEFKLPFEKRDSIKSSIFGRLRGNNMGYRMQRALDDINLEIKKGEFFGIVGRNGSGKSTLLKIIAEIYQPTSGKVHTKGKLVPFIELGVGFNPRLTGRENVYLNSSVLGMSQKETDDNYEKIVAFSELDEFMDQQLKNYSSGMQVRLAFACAIFAKADIYLIDEVLAVGDAAFQEKCFNYFRKLKESGKTVVFISHNMGQIREFCDRVALIEKSKVVEIGSADHIADLYQELFINNTIGEAGGNLNAKGRPGDGAAEWENVTASFTNDSQESIRIVGRGKVNKNIERPVFGFAIKNRDFRPILGYDTTRVEATGASKIKPLKKGQDFEIVWTIPNILNSGIHHIDFHVSHENIANISDRWTDATTIMINREGGEQYMAYTSNIEFEEK